MLSILRPIWACRGFVLSGVKREFKPKHLNIAMTGLLEMKAETSVVIEDRLEIE